jgi:C-terminal processing protease CtpA/Prc
VAPGIGVWAHEGWRNRPANYSEQIAISRYLDSGITRGRDGHMYHGTTREGLGYLRIRDFSGEGWVGDIDRAIAALYDTPGLIVDVRDNGGGTDLLSDPIAGRFADQKRLAERVRYRNGPAHDQFTDWIDRYLEPSGPRRYTKPVVLLTNRRVVSTAEAFVLLLRTLPHVTVVGDTTAGGSGNPIARELPNGWSFRLSRWQTQTPQGTSYEGVGLAPAVPVWISEADAREGRDTILERAIALLAGN